MQRISQQQRQSLKLSPQQLQLLKLLQVPTAMLEERIKEEMEENPALETASDSLDDEYEEPQNDNDDAEEDYITEESGVDNLEEINLSDYIKEGDDEDADYNFKSDSYNADDDDGGYSNTPKSESSFYENIMSQLSLQYLTEQEQTIAEHIIGSLDDDGYLRRDLQSIVDDLSFRQNITTSVFEISKLLKIIQEFDPAGLGAQNLQECLLLQLIRFTDKNDTHKIATKIVKNYFEELTKKHYPKIQKSLSLSETELKNAITLITKLNPKPGGSIAHEGKLDAYIIPDFIIENTNNELILSLNSRNAPDLRVSSGYREMLKDYDKSKSKDPKIKDAVFFLKQKLDSAKWFIDAIKQRQHTLYSVMKTILNYHEDFFYSGDDVDLRPMILKNIAERTGLDISTVSRVANSKYVLTEFGTFSLKHFFSESISTDSGEEVSTKEVKKILEEAIAAENKKKPISDEQLADLLNKKGYNIARRTVAKYREQLNIPVARLRKEL